MQALSSDEWLKLAVEAFDKGQFSSKQACADAYDVKISTFKGRFKGYCRFSCFNLGVFNLFHASEMLVQLDMKVAKGRHWLNLYPFHFD